MNRLGKLFTIPQVARKVGWSCEKAAAEWRTSRCSCKECTAGYQRMRRHLLTQNAQLHGMLLVNAAPDGAKAHYVLTLEALEQLHPQWFVSAEGLAEQVAGIADQVEDLDVGHDELLKALRGVAERVARLEKRAGV